MLNLIHVRTYLAVIDEKGVRAAAKALALSPSTVVEHVDQLEADLAAPLVIRSRGATCATA
jgi:DNA-binding transcriptional LysR family regulator